MRKLPGTTCRRQAGLTLLECLAVVTLSGLLLALAVPRLANVASSLAVYQARSQLTGAIERARLMAVQRGLPVTLCPLGNGGRCSNDWHRQLVVFADPAADYRLNAHADRYNALPARDRRIRLIMRPGWRLAIRFHSDGTAPGMQGHMAFCADDATTSAGRLVFSGGGRIRYVNGDPDQRGCGD